MKVSVICTNYNKGDWVKDALDGILSQKFEEDFEIIVVDDASTDHSPDIIKSYQEQYADRIRAIFHPVNLGITKTWKSICLEAKGDYIARCDADDYWTDEYKLQKQYQALKSSPESQWCVTDFDILQANHQDLSQNAIANHLVRKMSTFEEELAYKGMTMSSTWLVDRQLMLAANERLSDDAVDDTFNLQLELFQTTQLTFLNDSTTVYRLGHESDSHSENFPKMEERFERLKETQLDYLKNGKNIDFPLLSSYLIEEVTELEKNSFRLQSAKQMTDDYVKIIEKEKNDSVIAKKQADLMVHELQKQLDQMVGEREYFENQYNRVIHSRRWTIPTKIIKFFRRDK